MEFIAACETRIILVRHGHVEDNSSNGNTRLCGWLDPPLSNTGRKEARELAQCLASCFPIERLYASTLRRSRETAWYLASAIGIEPRLLRTLREINCGSLEGWRLTDIKSHYPELWQRNLSQSEDEFSWPGGESYADFRRRVMRAIACIAARHPGGRVLLVTHAGVISQIFGMITGLRPARWEAFRPSNASISEVSWSGESHARIVRFDDRTCAPSRTP